MQLCILAKKSSGLGVILSASFIKELKIRPWRNSSGSYFKKCIGLNQNLHEMYVDNYLINR